MQIGGLPSRLPGQWYDGGTFPGANGLASAAAPLRGGPLNGGLVGRLRATLGGGPAMLLDSEMTPAAATGWVSGAAAGFGAPLAGGAEEAEPAVEQAPSVSAAETRIRRSFIALNVKRGRPFISHGPRMPA